MDVRYVTFISVHTDYKLQPSQLTLIIREIHLKLIYFGHSNCFYEPPPHLVHLAYCKMNEWWEHQSRFRPSLEISL